MHQGVICSTIPYYIFISCTFSVFTPLTHLQYGFHCGGSLLIFPFVVVPLIPFPHHSRLTHPICCLVLSPTCSLSQLVPFSLRVHFFPSLNTDGSFPNFHYNPISPFTTNYLTFLPLCFPSPSVPIQPFPFHRGFPSPGPKRHHAIGNTSSLPCTRWSLSLTVPQVCTLSVSSTFHGMLHHDAASRICRICFPVVSRYLP